MNSMTDQCVEYAWQRMVDMQQTDGASMGGTSRVIAELSPSSSCADTNTCFTIGYKGVKLQFKSK
jgi:hypothetical protein